MNGFMRPSRRIRSGVLLAALWLVIAGLAANAVWVVAFAQPPTTTPTPALSRGGALVAARTPYTVVLQESTQRPSEDATPQGSMTFALRSDGAFVVRYEHLGIPAVIQRTIELPTGVSVLVDDIRERRTSTVSRVGPSARARMDPAHNCINNSLGEPVFPGQIVSVSELVAGYDTVEVNSGNATLWFARQLGCAQVKSRTPLSEGVVNEKVATLLIPGEPDNALFYIPERYNEVPPSTFHNVDPNSRDARTLDRSYYARRPPR